MGVEYRLKWCRRGLPIWLERHPSFADVDLVEAAVGVVAAALGPLQIVHPAGPGDAVLDSVAAGFSFSAVTYPARCVEHWDLVHTGLVAKANVQLGLLFVPDSFDYYRDSLFGPTRYRIGHPLALRTAKMNQRGDLKGKLISLLKLVRRSRPLEHGGVYAVAGALVVEGPRPLSEQELRWIAGG